MGTYELEVSIRVRETNGTVSEMNKAEKMGDGSFKMNIRNS